MKNNSPFSPPQIVGKDPFVDNQATAHFPAAKCSPTTNATGNKVTTKRKTTVEYIPNPEWKNGNVEMLAGQHKRLHLISAEYGIPVKCLTWRAITDFLEFFDSLKDAKQATADRIRAECPHTEHKRELRK